MVICDVKFDTKDDQIIQNSSQESSTSSEHDCVLDALLIMLWSWKLAYSSIMTYDDYFWCQIWYQIRHNPLKLQSGSIKVLQVWLCAWCTFNHARELKIGKQLIYDIWLLFVMSNLIPNRTKTSKTLVRNH